MKSIKFTAMLLMVAAMLGAPSIHAKDHADIQWKQALNAEHRSDANKARDAHRHPKQTLEFFGLRSDMTVIELWPGGGWYTEVLAPVLAKQGKLIVAGFPEGAGGPEYHGKLNAKMLAKIEAEDSPFGHVAFGHLDPKHGTLTVPAGGADMVLSFRNFHGWTRADQAEAVMKLAHTALKPGGVFGVVQHRAAEGADAKATAKSGYVPEAYLIDLAEKAGFTLQAKSDINANAKDTKNHEKGVWTLPPSYALGDQDKAKYADIGESDRMTLKFVKKCEGSCATKTGKTCEKCQGKKKCKKCDGKKKCKKCQEQSGEQDKHSDTK